MSLDGGGSKCVCVVFDSDLNVLGSGAAGGTNTTQNPPEVVRANVAACIGAALDGTGITEIERFYYCIVGPQDVMLSEAASRVKIRETVPMTEPIAGLLASAVADSGILVISGTGSDMFVIENGGFDEKGPRPIVGGWGPILGDQGSGTWIGRNALLEFSKAAEGWGRPSLLWDMIRAEYKLGRDYDLVGIVHGDPSPFRVAAGFTKLAGRAAEAGDAFCRELLGRAGEELALQTLCLIERRALDGNRQTVTCCGGAWKSGRFMFESFRETLAKTYPGIAVHKPLFEHVMAGPVRMLRDEGLTRDDIIEKVRTHFTQYVIGW